MKTKFRLFIKALTAFIGIVTFIGLFIYWVNNPTLTEMQVFLKFWWVYLIGLAFLVTSQLINYE